MNQLLKPIFLGQTLFLAALTLAAVPAPAQQTLTLNGKTTPADIRTLSGSAYVKMSDVARALGMIVVKRPGGYTLTREGGADQVQAVTQGKVGDVLFDGRWRFQVRSVETLDSYTAKFLDDTRALHYDSAMHQVHTDPGFKVMAIYCRMTNGQKSVQTFWIAPVSGRNINNALTDTEGESYPPDSFDLDGTGSQSKPLLPGAKTDFVILFRVPETTQLKDLVFTLQNNDSSHGNDVRVSLTP